MGHCLLENFKVKLFCFDFQLKCYFLKALLRCPGTISSSVKQCSGGTIKEKRVPLCEKRTVFQSSTWRALFKYRLFLGVHISSSVKILYIWFQTISWTPKVNINFLSMLTWLKTNQECTYFHNTSLCIYGNLFYQICDVVVNPIWIFGFTCRLTIDSATIPYLTIPCIQCKFRKSLYRDNRLLTGRR